VASQDWFTSNLRQAVKDIPKTKIICAIGSYGYDWKLSGRNKRIVNVDTNNVQEAWLHARESAQRLNLIPTPSILTSPTWMTMARSTRWFLDAVTALNQMRASRDLGIRTFALWRLGSKIDLYGRSGHPTEAGAEQKFSVVPAGEDVDREGDGEILYIQHRPTPGQRESRLIRTKSSWHRKR